MLSLGRIKNFVFARQASPRGKFSARLAVQKESFYSPETQHDKGLCVKNKSFDLRLP